MTERPTLWQQFWRSPWTWLGFIALTMYNISQDHGTWLILDWVFLAIFILSFFRRANERWGEP